MLTRYRRAGSDVDAILFDGSALRAAAISAAFGGSVAHHGEQIEVATNFGRVYAGARCWVVRDRATQVLSVIDDRDFSARYEALDLR